MVWGPSIDQNEILLIIDTWSYQRLHDIILIIIISFLNKRFHIPGAQPEK